MFRMLSETNKEKKLNYKIELDLRSPLRFLMETINNFY